MNHIMFDCYGSNPVLLDDLSYINKIMNEIPFILGLTTVTPPALIPYYYGKVREDNGVSSYVILDGGHLTVHTFPGRKCYFLDLYNVDNINEEALENYLSDVLPFKKDSSNILVRDRLEEIRDVINYNPKEDFGPHVLLKIKPKNTVNLETIYDFLENLVLKVGMTPIIRPHILKSKVKKPKYLTGITMIAESHISVHYNLKEGVIYSDIFSCMPFDYSGLGEIYKELGEIVSFEVCARGSKHYPKIADMSIEIFIDASKKWKKNIYK